MDFLNDLIDFPLMSFSTILMSSFDFPSVQLAKELLLPLAKDEQRKHKLKRLVQVSKIA